MVFKYCPKCKGNLRQRKDNLLVCNNCNFNWYQNPIPCNSAILENGKGKILLIKRKWPPKKGFYDLPGGFVDLDETLDESMKRELKEELGVEPLNLKFFCTTPQDRYLYNGVNYHTIGFTYTGSVKQAEVRALDDVGSIEFFPKDKIPFEKLAFKVSLGEALRQYLKKN